jgi:hypothetical protein
VSSDELPPFLAQGAASAYWRALAFAVNEPHRLNGMVERGEDAVGFEDAVELCIAVAQSSDALRLVERVGPNADPEEKLTQLLAWLLADRVEVLDEAIERVLPPGEEQHEPHPALPLLLRTRLILTR